MTPCWMTAAALFVVAAAQTGQGVARSNRESLHAYHAQARRAVDQVLAEREFAHLHADPYASGRAFLEWLRGIFRSIGNALGALPEWVLWLVVAWMVITLVAILAHLVYTLYLVLGSSSRTAAARARGARHEGELFGIRDLEFESVYERARALLAEGNWAEATKYLYVAAILWLDRQGRIAFRLSKTNYDYLRELRAPDDQAQFRRLTERFEATVYGGMPANGPECERVASVVEGFVHEAAPAGAQ
jgi:hypothetical protein